jgi:hypothetical protein
MERAMVSPNTSPIVQAVNAVPQTDPRVLTSRGYEPDNIALPAATVMNQQDTMMASVMQQARNLAARAGLNFDTMSQEQKAQYINAVMPLN